MFRVVLAEMEYIPSKPAQTCPAGLVGVWRGRSRRRSRSVALRTFSQLSFHVALARRVCIAFTASMFALPSGVPGSMSAERVYFSGPSSLVLVFSKIFGKLRRTFFRVKISLRFSDILDFLQFWVFAVSGFHVLAISVK